MSYFKKRWKERFIDEFKSYVAYTLFFMLFFLAFTLYKKLIIKEFDLSYVRYSYSILEAMVLAKIIVIGQMFHLGERFNHKPLIIPTLYKTSVFTCLVLIFTILEEFLLGYLRGNSFSSTLTRFLGHGLDETLAKMLVMFFVFILFFAFLELSRVMGKGKLFNLFFKK